MSQVIVTLSESALFDLEEIKDWYVEQAVPEVGEKILLEIFEHLEVLKSHPDIGRVVPEFGQSILREIIHPPFRLVYRRDKERVRVIRVWRGERKLKLSTEDTE